MDKLVKLSYSCRTEFVVPKRQSAENGLSFFAAACYAFNPNVISGIQKPEAEFLLHYL